jgi:diaminohydroxyphosphoribosylaminopyrimidine deaminase/5-amino-6-(5-phosphoribosylamino)uracil reductase
VTERELLDLAGRAALRGVGRVEPNPLVGCVITDVRGEIVGIGHHAVWGGVHAERAALAHAARTGRQVRGGTAWVTLEPCAHVGKQPPCVDALIASGIARVVFARRDPNPVAAGGAERLRAAGLEAVESGASVLATRVSDPFVHRVRSGRAWVIAKWAQLEDGRMVTWPGEGRWITGPWARRRVHRLRGMANAIVTGIGTVRADDPELTVRGVRARRVPARVVLDARCELPAESKLVRTVHAGPVVVLCGEGGLRGTRAGALRAAGVCVMEVSQDSAGRVELRGAIARLSEPGWDGRAGTGACATVLIEAGPGVLASAFAAGVVDEAVVHVAGVGVDADAAVRAACLGAGAVDAAEAWEAMEVLRVRPCGPDVEVCARRRIER